MTKNQFKTDAEAYIKIITPNYAPSTVNEKARKLRFYANIFYRLYEDGKLSTNTPAKITADDINAYVTYRREQGTMDSTITKDLSIIGMFLKWKGNDARDIYNVSYGNMKPRSYDGRLSPLPDEVIEKVYDLARKTTDWPMMEGCMATILGCACGLRPQESRRIYVSDIHLAGDRSTIYVRHVKGEGKWGRRRTVPVMDGAEDIIRKYLEMRAQKLREHSMVSDSLFPSFRGKGEFMEQQSYGRLKSLVEDAIDYRYELRDGRRAYGQRMLNRGYPIEFVSFSMGHASIETTQKFYANYAESQVLDGIFAIKNADVSGGVDTD